MKAPAVVAVVVCALPAGALAKSAKVVPIVPPSNSGADQYVENVPTASGNGSSTAIVRSSGGQTPATGSGQTGSTAGNSAVTPSTRLALSKQGSDGARTAALAIAAAPSGAPTAHQKAKRTSAAASPTNNGGNGGGPAGSAPAATVVRSIVGGHGVDAWLPAVLAVVAAAVVVLAVRRRHTN